jgi:hypothetical protein
MHDLIAKLPAQGADYKAAATQNYNNSDNND